MSFPQVKVNVANGNLMQSVAVLDSVPALMLTVSTEELVAKTQQVYIGADKYEDRVDMETLHDAGFLTTGGVNRRFATTRGGMAAT